jgi:flagellum-specific peptidoglycan hydrolase FlgJ
MIQQIFIDTLAPMAIMDMLRTGVLASITIAQAALESGWGAAAPGNNLFGIKGTGQEFTTQEYENGHFVTVTDGFRVYDSWEGSVIDHGDFLVQNGRYDQAGFFDRCTEKDYIGAAQSLQNAGYATDPKYAAKLVGIIQNWGLAQYDVESDIEEVEIDMAVEDANKLIELLRGMYNAGLAKEEAHRLCNVLRKASGQPEE